MIFITEQLFQSLFQFLRKHIYGISIYRYICRGNMSMFAHVADLVVAAELSRFFLSCP